MQRLIELEIVELAMHSQSKNEHQQDACSEYRAPDPPADQDMRKAGDEPSTGTNGNRGRHIYWLQFTCRGFGAGMYVAVCLFHQRFIPASFRSRSPLSKPTI